MKYERTQEHQQKRGTTMKAVSENGATRLKSFQERGHEFALEIIRLYAELSSRTVDQCIGKQLLRSGTSVGAQLSEGKRSRSRSEIISKTESALQELEESIYWMRLLKDASVTTPQRVETLIRNADELMAILTAGVRRLKFMDSPTR